MGTQWTKIIYLSIATLLGACAQQSSKGVGNTPTTRGTDSGSVSTSSVRYCDPAISPINNSSTSKLSSFFSVIVSELEGAPSFCHEIQGVGTDVDMYLMVEYEDRFGIRAVSFRPDNIVSRRLNDSTSNSNDYVLDIIYKDAYGLVRINAGGPKSTGILTGNIYYYNFPSYEEALNAEIERIRQACQDGTKTVYECMGYTYPTHWWNQPAHTSEGQRVKEMAKAIMNDSSKRKHLGAITIDIAEITFPE